jgi:hypothetical protein
MANSNWRRWETLFIQWGILFISSLMISGYQLYSDNQAVQIPLILSYNNSSLFPNDPFIDTLVHYASPFYRVVAELINYINLESLLVLLFLFTRALILFAAAYLAIVINPGSKLSAVGAMAWFALFPTPIIGHGTLVMDYFEHTSLAVAFLLLAVAAFYAHRVYLWAILLAVGFSLNIMYGTFACVYLAGAFMIDPDYRSAWKKFVFPGILFLILAAPTILLILSSLSTESFDLSLWFKVSQVRMPYHLYPLTWESYRFNLLLAFAIANGLVLYFVRKSLPKLSKHGFIWLCISSLWVLFAFLTAYILKSPTLLATHPARGTDLWFAFASITNIAAIAYMVEKKEKLKRLSTILFFISVMWLNFFYSPVITILIVFVITVLLTIPDFWKFLINNDRPALISYAIVTIVLAFGIINLNEDLQSYTKNGLVKLPDSELRKVANWAKEETPNEGVFLIDPNWEEFRPLAQRSVFVTWKDGTAILWDKVFVEEWVTRIEEIGFDFSTAELGTSRGSYELSWDYQEMDDTAVLDLASRYPLHYWVVKIDKTSSYPVVYRTNDFKVLQIQ